jgi:hypothetical protein
MKETERGEEEVTEECIERLTKGETKKSIKVDRK